MRIAAGLSAVAMLVAGTPLLAQGVGPCETFQTIRVTGNKRVAAATVVSDAGLLAGTTVTYAVVQKAIKALFETGQYDDVVVECEVTPGTPNKVAFNIRVTERPLLDNVDVAGPARMSLNTVRDRIDLLIGRPVNPAMVATGVQRIDSLYQANGYYLAQIKPETTVTAPDHISILFRVDEGRRLAISGVRVRGSSALSAGEITSSMDVQPEGLLWWKRGEFDIEKYAKDLGERIPTLYSDRGYIDYQLVRDTLIVDRARGKGIIDLTISEGKQYHVGAFEATGNKLFSTADIARFYPFSDSAPSLAQRVSATVRRKRLPKGVFDQSVWEAGTEKLRNAYANQGYIYSQVRQIVDRQVGPDSQPVVNLRWDITEGTPAIINRIEIIGNDYTTESCIRDQLVIIPGDVFNRERLVRSWQSIGNLGFFETPITPPETRPANEQGDVDIVFKVKEKRTGMVNFGASMGQGTGLGGFIGLEQPNLFGHCKRGTLNWQFGRYINDFQLSYTDPSIYQSRFSGTLTAYRAQSRYTIADLGQQTRTGGQLRIGFPLMNSRYTRVFTSYGAEAVRYGNFGVFGTVTTNQCAGCFRSTFGVDIARDTRIELPFPTDGILQSVSSQFNGGILGGSATFQRYTTEFKSYATLKAFGDARSGEQIKLTTGLSQRTGFVFGDPGPFGPSQAFALGGVQYGEPLRGYPEFSITPNGFNPNTNTTSAVRSSFGNAFFTFTAELGLRISSQFSAAAFFEAGNVWARPVDFNPTRLFRGMGVGGSAITPLGPLGLDWAYGFDRVDALGKPDPKWMVHFRLGQFFY